MAYTPQQIKGYVQEQGIVNDPGAMYTAAKKYGVTGSQMDEAMGWQGGTADNWTKQQGYESLGTTSQGGGTGGALASWATDPTNMTADQYKTMAGPMQGATTYTPSDNALVSNNLTKLLASDNPYMTLARSKAQAYSNSRGLLNSTMAGQAGERAAIESALPIAQQDASSYFTSERDNASAQNTFARDANAFGREGALTTAKAGFGLGAQREGQTWKSGESALDRTLQTTENAAEREFRTGEREATEAFTTGRDTAQFNNRLTEISAQTDAQIKLLDKQQGTNLYAGYRTASQGINDDYAAAVARINESDMDPDVKQAQIAALQTLTEQRQTFLNTLYANSPQWADEWSMFAVAPGEATAGGA